MRPRLLLTINDCKFAVDFFARGLHTRTAVARLPLRQLGFLVLLWSWFEVFKETPAGKLIEANYHAKLNCLSDLRRFLTVV